MDNKSINSPSHSIFRVSKTKAFCSIIIIGFIVFGNALFNDFLWDDIGYIINNPEVHGINLLTLFGENKYNHFFYRPINAFYNAIVFSVFGASPFYFHFFQVSLHIFNAILIFLLFRKIFFRISTSIVKKEELEWDRLSGSQRIKLQRNNEAKSIINYNKSTDIDLILALILSLIFLVHPINVESVSYIATIQSELFFVFGISAFLVSTKQSFDKKHLVTVAFLLLLSLLSKEPGIIFFILIIFYQYLFNKERIKSLLVMELAAISIYIFLRFIVAKVYFVKFFTLVPIPIAELSFMERVTNIPAIVFYYIKTLFFPLNLIIAQKWVVEGISLGGFIMPLTVSILFFVPIIMFWRHLRRDKNEYFKIYSFFSIWFFLGFVMIIQLYPLDMTVADRWFYFPIVGILGMLGVAIHHFLGNSETKKKYNIKKSGKILTICALVIILLFSARTIIRNKNFKDEITLYAHDARLIDNPILEENLATDYAQKGDLELAHKHLQRSVELLPFTHNLFHLGNYYEEKGDIGKAVNYYFEALRISEDFYRKINANSNRREDESNIVIYKKLIKLLILYGEYEKSSIFASEGVKHYPEDAVLWEYLAISSNKIGNHEVAINAANKASSLSNTDLIEFLLGAISSKNVLPELIIQLYLKEQDAYNPFNFTVADNL